MKFKTRANLVACSLSSAVGEDGAKSKETQSKNQLFGKLFSEVFCFLVHGDYCKLEKYPRT